MVLATSNKQQKLICLQYVQRVSRAELAAVLTDVEVLLADLPSGIRLLADLSQVDFMDPDGSIELGRSMDLMDQHGVSLIVRVIPDSSKDIGLNILTVFHYAHQPRIITCQNLAEALKQLALWV